MNGSVELGQRTLRVDDHALVEEQLGHLHAGLERAARVAAQVEDQPLHPVGLQTGQRLFHVLDGRILEVVDLDVADRKSPHIGRHVQHQGVHDARQVDRLALDLNGVLAAVPLVLDIDQGPGFAAQQIGGLVGVEIALAVDADDAVVRQELGFSRAFRVDADDLNLSVSKSAQIDADADVLALEHGLHVVVVAGRQKQGVFVQGVAGAGRELQTDRRLKRGLEVQSRTAGDREQRQHFLPRVLAALDLVRLPIVQPCGTWRRPPAWRRPGIPGGTRPRRNRSAAPERPAGTAN